MQEEWGQEMETKPKLEILKRIVKLGEWLECVRVVRGADRRMHGTISNRDGKMEGGDQKGGNMQGM